MKTIYFISLSLLLIMGCAFNIKDAQIPSNNEIVMTEGMQISATNKTGTILIRAGKGFERFYTWEGETRSQVLEPRKERWAGRFGIGFSGANIWSNHNTITDANLEETQLHFANLGTAMSFLGHPSRKDGFTVYSDTGLMVTWEKAIHPAKGTGNVLIVEVVQIYIAEQKPNKLPGSKNDKISVSVKP